MVAVGVWVGAQVLRTEIQRHKHAMAECLVIIGDRITEANLAAQRQEELMTQRRVIRKPGQQIGQQIGRCRVACPLWLP